MTIRRSACLLLLAGTSAAAAEPTAAPGAVVESSPSELDDLSLERLLSVMVTAASRTPEAAEDAPASMTVFTREQIQRMGITTLEDLLN